MLSLSASVFLCTDGGTSNDIPLAHRQKMEERGIQVITTPVAFLESDLGKLRTVHFQDGKSESCDAMFFNTGRKQEGYQLVRLLDGVECSFNKKGMLAISEQCQLVGGTRVFASGNCSDEAIDFVVMAAANGALAAVNINRFLLKEDLGLEEI